MLKPVNMTWLLYILDIKTEEVSRAITYLLRMGAVKRNICLCINCRYVVLTIFYQLFLSSFLLGCVGMVGIMGKCYILQIVDGIFEKILGLVF